MTCHIEAFPLTVADGAVLVAYRAFPDCPAKGLVQIAHGMAEHFSRYARLTGALTAAGYAVYGIDHRGHGDSAKVHGLGDFGPRGFAAVVTDTAELTQFAKLETSGPPVALLGHSMGSFAAQQYLLDHGDLLDGLVLSGTASLAPLMQALAAAGAAPGLEAFNAGFEPARTPFDWLSRDEAEVDAYVADPMCGFALTETSMASMFALCAGAAGDPRLARVRKDLPILVLSGEVDPVVGPSQAYAMALIEAWRAAGLTRIQHRVYPGARHELINEICRDQVTGDLIAWLGAAMT
jgi:alpha-beta hydrolase superfamily lysophospholipase